MCNDVLLKYAKPLAACESTLRSISYLLPGKEVSEVSLYKGRFPHADIASEAGDGLFIS
jgi:hypothetical protein